MKNIVLVLLVGLVYNGCFFKYFFNNSKQKKVSKSKVEIKNKNRLINKRISLKSKDNGLKNINESRDDFVIQKISNNYKKRKKTLKIDKFINAKSNTALLFEDKPIDNVIMNIKIEKFYNNKNNRLNICFETKPLYFTYIDEVKDNLANNLDLNEVALYNEYNMNVIKKNGINYIKSTQYVFYPQNFMNILVADNIILKENKINSRKLCITKQLNSKDAKKLIKDELVLKLEIDADKKNLHRGYIIKKATKKDPYDINATYYLFTGIIDKFILFDKKTKKILFEYIKQI